MIEPYYSEGGITIYCADCRDVLPMIAPPLAAAVVTDPPYGIASRWDKQVVGRNGQSRLWTVGANHWDTAITDADLVVGLAVYPAIIWGGNFYPLPPVRGWLIWDKVQRFGGGDFEMAWTNLDIPPRVYRLSRIDAYFNHASEPKQHPTEKPVALMRWCLSFLRESYTILDPFMGSGTTLRAAKDLGRKAIGIEISEEYCRIAVQRLQQEVFDFAALAQAGQGGK